MQAARLSITRGASHWSDHSDFVSSNMAADLAAPMRQPSLRGLPARECVMVEFDQFSGKGLDTLEMVWEPCVKKFKMAPPLVVCCVSQDDTVSVSVMRLNGPGDHEVESPTRPMSFKLPLAVVIVDRKNAIAKATVETNGALGAVVGPPL
jgi:hypothetical protein